MNNSQPSFVFITGMIRSGTTFTQRLLDSNSHSAVVYQPLTGLFLSVANLYFKELGLLNSHPLLDHPSNVQKADRDFTRWLSTEKIKSSLITHELEAFGSKIDVNFKDGLSSALERNFHINFVDLWKLSHEKSFRHLGYKAIGSKEVLAQNFAQAFLDHGISVVDIVRNPHDNVLSITRGSYKTNVGHSYPLLQLVRLWRRSAQVHIEVKPRNSSLALKMEEVTRSPSLLTTWSEETLGLPAFPDEVKKGIIRDESGEIWGGNSSFTSMGKQDVDSEQTPKLSLRETKFIDATLRNSMQLMGYENKTSPSILSLISFSESEDELREKDLHAYRFTKKRLMEEIQIFCSGSNL